MAEIVALAGQTFPAVWDGMTWRDYKALAKQWQQWPPLPVSMAVLARLTPQQREQAGMDGPQDETPLATLEQLIGAPAPQG